MNDHGSLDRVALSIYLQSQAGGAIYYNIRGEMDAIKIAYLFVYFRQAVFRCLRSVVWLWDANDPQVSATSVRF